MAELVILMALVLIAQHFVGFRQFLKLRLSRLIVRIAIRMILHRKLAIVLLDRVGSGIPLNAKNFVVVSLLCHGGYSY